MIIRKPKISESIDAKKISNIEQGISNHEVYDAFKVQCLKFKVEECS